MHANNNEFRVVGTWSRRFKIGWFQPSEMFVCQTHDEEIVRGTRKSRIFDRGFLQAPIDLPHPSLRKHFRCEIHPIDLRHTFRSEPNFQFFRYRTRDRDTAASLATVSSGFARGFLCPANRAPTLHRCSPLGITNLWRNRWVLALIE